MWFRALEAEILPELRRLQVGLVAYAPLGRGFIVDALGHPGALPASDVRRDVPALGDEGTKANRAAVAAIRDVAARLAATAAQVALAWLHSRGGDVVPIPGTKRRRYLVENLQAASLKLGPEDLALLEPLADLVGEARYGHVVTNR